MAAKYEELLFCGTPSDVEGKRLVMQGNEFFHVMEGIPPWLGIVGIIAIIISSHLLIHFRKSKKNDNKYKVFSLFRIKWIKSLVKNPYFPTIAQFTSLVLFFLVITAGLYGNEKGNIAPVITWTWWWVLLIFIALGLGKFFCMVCPWEAVSSMVTSLSLKSRKKKLGFEKKWPKWARNIFPATIFFILLTWFELGNDVTHSASMTAILALVMLGMAVMSAIYFEKRSFCRYGCLVGRISGLYSMFAPLELRSVSADVCASCKTKDCYVGTETTTKCPTSLYPSKLEENTYCTLCTECVRSCPHDNLEINMRPMGVDLFKKVKFQWDEALLAIILLSLTSFHGLTMTPQWNQVNNIMRVETGWGPTVCFTILMTLMIVLPIWLFWISAKVSYFMADDKTAKVSDIFKAFSYSLIPIALFYHLAHNCMHFFMEAQKLFPLISDPFGFGWNLFGTADKQYGAWLSLETIWYLQVICIVVGHLYGVVLAERYAKRIFSNLKTSFVSLTPLIVAMILYSSFSMWLVMQPMEMRSGM